MASIFANFFSRILQPAAPPMSAIIKEMAERILIRGEDAPTPAREIAVLLAHFAWNQAIGYPSKDDRMFKKEVAAAKRELPKLWSEFVEPDYKVLLNILVQHKQETYPDDERLIAGIQLADDDRYEEGGRIRVVSVPKSERDAFQKLSAKEQRAMVARMFGG